MTLRRQDLPGSACPSPGEGWIGRTAGKAVATSRTADFGNAGPSCDSSSFRTNGGRFYPCETRNRRRILPPPSPASTLNRIVPAVAPNVAREVSDGAAGGRYCAQLLEGKEVALQPVGVQAPCPARHAEGQRFKSSTAHSASPTLTRAAKQNVLRSLPKERSRFGSFAECPSRCGTPTAKQDTRLFRRG